MANQIQGRHVRVQFFMNGRVVRGITAKSATYKSKNDVRERDLLGAERSSTQLLIHGYQGTITFDIESGRHHEIIQYLNDSDKSLAPAYELAIQMKEIYQDGTSKRFRFVKATFVPPEGDASGRKEDVKGTMEWHAEDIVYLD